MQIRSGQLSDAKSITQIQVDAWQIVFAEYIPEEILNNLAVDLRIAEWERLTREKVGELFVAEDSGEICGFLHLDQPKHESIELIRIYITPKRMREGIGEQLLNSALAYCSQKNIERVYLWVAEKNKTAHNFYEKHGFQIVQGQKRLESFSADGSAPKETRMKQGVPDAKLGEFIEVCYELKI